MRRAFDIYNDDTDGQTFKYLNIFARIEICEKWPDVHRNCRDPRDLGYTERLCVLVTLATSDTGVTSPRPKHYRQAGRN
jgi:hypothetical protein